MRLTNNYNLKMPEGSDVVNIEDLNYNTNVIDNTLLQNKNDILNINNDLSKTENTKYTTKNGVKEFSCKDGYVDNIVIEGQTKILNKNNEEVEAGLVGAKLVSVGQGDKIEVLSYNTTSSYDLSRATYATGYFNSIGGLDLHDKHKVIEQYLEVEENKIYVLENIAQATCYYDANKNVVGYCLESNICNSPYPHHIQDIHNIFYSVVKIPKGVKYIRVSTGVNSVGKVKIYKTSNYDHKQISTTLRSLPNGVKDTIEKRGNKYIKVQRCGEVTLNGNEHLGIYANNGNTAVFGVVHEGQTQKRGLGICDKFRYHMAYNTGEEHFYLEADNAVNIEISLSKLSSANEEGLKTWLQSNPITIVYELATPQIIELPNFNPQAYEGDTTLLINSGVIQGECNFEVTNSKGSEIEVLKDKVSSLDDYESGYEYSNEIIYLNGTYKVSWAETPYIVRIGKICILHCAIGNDAPQRGMQVLKLPSFAKPKEYHRCSGRGKINDETMQPVLVDYDITLDNTVQLWTTNETTKVNEVYIHIMWEVE